MIIERTEHSSWLSNAYLIADAVGGSGVLMDGHGEVEPLLDRIERDDISITHVLLTHEDVDHVVGVEELSARYDAPLVASSTSAAELSFAVGETVENGDVVRSGKLEFEVIATPGHSAGHLAYLVGGTDCFTADCLFKGTVGGTRGRGQIFERHRSSIMDRLMGLPPATRIHPGHCEPSTIGQEFEHNPFVRAWRGADEPSDEPCRVRGEEATLLLWGPDYDGTHKAWVRFASGEEAVVGGSQIER
jgi:glyoxylase-like metal-dependent hydrolase (beta-lactamase superfamily II)